MAVVLVDGWPTDKVEEASRLGRESGINIFFVTIEGPDDNEKQNLIEPNFVDKVAYCYCVGASWERTSLNQKYFAPCVTGRVSDERLLLPAREQLVRPQKGRAAARKEGVRHRPPGVQQNLPQRQ